MSSIKLNQLIERAQRMDDNELKATYERARHQVIHGRTFDGLSADECLMFCHSLSRIIQGRAEVKTSQNPSKTDLVKQLMKDVPGLTEEQALKYISEHGNPYLRESQPQQRGWDGIERRGVREPGFTAQDLDDPDVSASEAEQRTVTRRYTWGE